MLCREEERGGERVGSGGGKGEGEEGGGSALSTEGVGGGGGEAREGLNASHVKLMRTNLQKLESCFPLTSSLLVSFCFFSSKLRAINHNLPTHNFDMVQMARTKCLSVPIIPKTEG